jgi:Spy/CpxP family protein refolding chaperone
MVTTTFSMLALLAGALALAPFAAEAQSFRCVGKDGKKYYSSAIPQPCIGQPVEQLNAQGTVIRRIDPEGDEKARLAKEAEAEQRRKEETAQKEAARRNRALLATYTSDRDIDDARGRALVDNEKAIKDVEGRIAGIKKRQVSFDKELEFYQDKKGKAKPPVKLSEDIKNSEIDLRAQEELLAVKKKEVDNINAKYDDDKKRFAELTGKDRAGRAKPAGPESVKVTAKPPAVQDTRR